MLGGCKVYTYSYITSNESCFMVTWTVFMNNFFEVGLTQNRETMALWNISRPSINFILFICEDPTWIECIKIAFGCRPGHMWLHTTLESPWPHNMILGRPLHTSFGLSQLLHGHGSWLVCVWSGHPPWRVKWQLRFWESCDARRSRKG